MVFCFVQMKVSNYFFSHLNTLGSLVVLWWCSSNLSQGLSPKNKPRRLLFRILQTGDEKKALNQFFTFHLPFPEWNCGTHYTGRKRRKSCQCFPRKICSEHCLSGIEESTSLHQQSCELLSSPKSCWKENKCSKFSWNAMFSIGQVLAIFGSWWQL